MIRSFPLAVLCLASCAAPDPHSQASHERKLLGLQEKFDRFDYNADNVLRRSELETGIRESEVEGVTETELDALMKHYDVNGDGAISRWEARRAIESTPPQHE